MKKLDPRDKAGYSINMNRGRDWFAQAKDDLHWAEDTFKARRYAQVCFIAQQVAEKSLKALALLKGYVGVRSHSILQITKALDIDGEIKQMAKRLDQYYISARYPDAFIEGAPFEYFTEAQAEEALDFARKFILLVEEVVIDSPVE